MSLNGKLEDVSLADVMQFVHLGRRTGTLYLVRGSEEAEIGFHRGQIVSARSARTRSLAELLVDLEVLPGEVLEQVIRVQGSERPRRSLGQVLITSGVLGSEAVKRVVQTQVEATIYELVTWSTGSFEFALDELKRVEDLALYPGDTFPELGLNTQRVLLEAARLLDEARAADSPKAESDPVERARRRRAAADGEPEAASEPKEERLGEELALASVSEAIHDLELDFEEVEDLLPEAAHRRLQVVSPDRTLAEQLEAIIQPEIAQVVRVPLREAGTRLPGEPTPTVVLLDLRDGAHGVEDLLSIRRSRPRSSVIAVVDSPELTTVAFEAGALAAIGADPAALAACFHSLMRTLGDVADHSGSGDRRQRAGFARLRRVLADIRSGLLSATMALNLMHIISESVERAVLFLVREDRLTALGAFGFGADGRPLAEATRDLAVPLDGKGVLGRCAEDGRPRSVRFGQADLPASFAELLGAPRNGQVVVFPVMGSERVISLVYTDNGSSRRAIEDIELLELATAQVGVAFENELLRRQMESR